MPTSANVLKPAGGTAAAARLQEWAMAGADARVFVSVGDGGSLAAAAARHGQTPAAVGKAVARLEASLALRLVQGAARALELTDEGRAFHQRCTRAFALLDPPADTPAPSVGAVSGTVRLGVPALLGSLLVAPLLPPLLRRHPGLRIELVNTMRLADLPERKLDLMIAVGPLGELAPVARPVGYGRFVTVASPAYLRDAPAPKSPDALGDHRCLAFSGADGRQPPWRFTIEGQPWTVAVGAVARCDDMHHLAAMACAGVGIAQLPLFAVADAIDDGRLVALLPAYEPAPRLASFVHPSAPVPQRVRVLVEHLLAGTAPG